MGIAGKTRANERADWSLLMGAYLSLHLQFLLRY
jgi:hypothetical protein